MQIGYEVADGIATVTLDRPDRMNAFTPEMATEIVAAFDRSDADDAVRVVVLTGAGRAFCAGADLGRGGSTFDYAAVQDARLKAGGAIGGKPRDLGGVAVLRIAASVKPVIAAVNGPAVGIGASLLLPADIRIAAESARFGYVFTRRGIAPDGASSWFLPRVVGISQAMEWVATGRVFGAAEALAGRLVSRVVPDDELGPAVRALAAEIAENTSGVSVALTRRMMWSMLGAESPWDAHRMDTRVIAALGAGPDATEGVTSFLEKRPPEFTASPGDYLDLVDPWPGVPDDLEPPT
ncbi:enoyl-CoA hydratase-related protein [Actinomycetospora corticicola]|uniref:Enoyl-CoA hydratase/carnithine racemase n=1 Tax=Actinomycetospora corticicola TaxID=663602 RepID=A0A7Y9DST5_9PSEU|nr:enoyl-CoA hydratase-related protein [Actinomycetospora corticicola]NYD34887.1 enoyl-CoA hydratase/carnithine racemase [Actinomycetospora corticicola]